MQKNRHMPVEDGILYDNVLGGRVFYLSAKTFSEMAILLGDSIPPQAAQALLWNIGQRYGISLGKRAVRDTASPDEAVKMLSYAAFKSGWGRNTVINKLSSENLIEVTFENCVFCHDLRNMQNPVCYFLSGILAGIGEPVFNKRFNGREIECRAAGGSICRFMLSPV